LNITEPKCAEGHAWTQFFDRDNPSGYGDYETLNHLLNENPGKLCKKPTAIDARLVSNNAPYQSANQVVTISTISGFYCVNSQNSGLCKDYKVRFCCPSAGKYFIEYNACDTLKTFILDYPFFKAYTKASVLSGSFTQFYHQFTRTIPVID